MSLSQPCQAGGAPRAYFSCAGKVGKSALGSPRSPAVCPIGRKQRGYPVATELPLACWPLVIGAVGYALRLTALVLRSVSFLLMRTYAVLTDTDSPTQNPRFACPFKRPSGEVGRAARRRLDPRRIHWFSGSAATSPAQTD